MTHSIWSLHLRFLVAEPDEGRNSNAVKHPGRKTEVIYERFKATGVWQQHDPGNDTLTKSKEKRRRGRIIFANDPIVCVADKQSRRH